MKKGLSGIYKILNKENNKIYVGSASCLARRFSDHKCFLKKNSHKNKHLQNAWNKYGEKSFEFIVIEYLPKEKNILLEREQYFLDLYKSYDREIGYNIEKIAGSSLGVKRSEETCKKLSIIAKERIEKGKNVVVRRGEESISSRLTWEIVNSMRAEYRSGKYSRAELANKYSIKTAYFSQIMKGIYWNDGSEPVRKLGKTSEKFEFLRQNQADILVMYTSGSNINKIAKKYNIDRHIISAFLKSIGKK